MDRVRTAAALPSEATAAGGALGRAGGDAAQWQRGLHDSFGAGLVGGSRGGWGAVSGGAGRAATPECGAAAGRWPPVGRHADRAPASQVRRPRRAGRGARGGRRRGGRGGGRGWRGRWERRQARAGPGAGSREPGAFSRLFRENRAGPPRFSPSVSHRAPAGGVPPRGPGALPGHQNNISYY